MNHTSSVRFVSPNGENNELIIVQRVNGLNVWDQLAIDIEVSGDIPSVLSTSTIVFPDTTDAYIFRGENKIQSDGEGFITVDDQNTTFIISQMV